MTGYWTIGMSLPIHEYVPTDDFFGTPYIDVDETREHPTSHRYIHGAFLGTETRFSFYLPPQGRFEGRFFQYLDPAAGGNEKSAHSSGLWGLAWVDHIADIEQAFQLGGALVECNQGHNGDLAGIAGDLSIMDWRANAETGRLARWLVGHCYAEPVHHGYIFGGCAGGFRCLKAMARAPKVWDGALAWHIPPLSQGLLFSQQANTMRRLARKRPELNKLLDNGVDERAFAQLDEEEAEALRLLMQCGYPRNTPLTNDQHARYWAFISGTFATRDPTYARDFWSKPGYAGHQPSPSLEADRLQIRCRVKRLLTASDVLALPRAKKLDLFGIGDGIRVTASLDLIDPNLPIGLELDADDLSKAGCAQIKVLSGEATDRVNCLLAVVDQVVVASPWAKMFQGVAVGDEVSIDNTAFLSWCFYHRHHQNRSRPEWHMLDGKPVYPRRRPMTANSMSFAYDYDFAPDSKVILLQSMADTSAYPVNAAEFATGLEAASDRLLSSFFRLWFLENSSHFPGCMSGDIGASPPPKSRLIDFQGCVHQALDDLVRWTEKDQSPPPSSRFEVTADQQVRLPTSAGEGPGIQAVVSIAQPATGPLVARAGEPLVIEAFADVPPGCGAIVSCEWDEKGDGDWKPADPISAPATSGTFRRTITFDDGGQYVTGVRVKTHRQGEPEASGRLVANIARIGVEVRPDQD